MRYLLLFLVVLLAISSLFFLSEARFYHSMIEQYRNAVVDLMIENVELDDELLQCQREIVFRGVESPSVIKPLQ